MTLILFLLNYFFDQDTMQKFRNSLYMLAVTMTIPLCAQQETLIQQAQQAQTRAYCPYSHYAVGAALLTGDGEVIQGANVENASYGLTICAERAALFAAVSQGKQHFQAIVVSTTDGGTPCGACRQVLNEFNPHIKVITVDHQGTVVHSTTLDKLLPSAFGPQNLDLNQKLQR